MTDMYTEQQGSKKKYLIPLVVLLLCAVSLTGAGYAYSSNITGSDDIGDKYYDLTFSNDGANKSTIGIASTDYLVFDSVTKDGSTTYTLNEDDTSDVSIKVKIDAKNNTDGFKVIIGNCSAAVYTDSACTAAVDAISVAVDDSAAGTGATEHTLTLTFSKVAEKSISSIQNTYYIQLVVDTEAVNNA